LSRWGRRTMPAIGRQSMDAKTAFAEQHANRVDDAGRCARDVLLLAARVEELEAALDLALGHMRHEDDIRQGIRP
jgi:hypothetical protein